jgi:hypothetical protein
MIGGSNSGRGWEFGFTTASRPVLGPTQPAIQWVLEPFSLGVKRQGREVDHPRPSSAGFKECVELYLHSPKTHMHMGQASIPGKNRGFSLHYRIQTGSGALPISYVRDTMPSLFRSKAMKM